MRLWKMLGCAALGLLLAAPARAENIKIGVMLPYSGVNADLGDVQDKAIDLFMKLHGKDLAPNTVELIKRDPERPDRALEDRCVRDVERWYAPERGDVVR